MKLKLIFSFILLSLFIASAHAADAPNFNIDGQPFTSPSGEPKPYINKEGRTMVPVRFVANALGIEDKNIKWDKNTSTSTIIKAENTVSITLSKRLVTVNGNAVQMDTQAELSDNRLFIPVRYMAEGLGARVEWDGKTRTIYILSDPTNNMARHFGEKVSFPVKIEGQNLQYKINNLFIYPTGSEEYKNYVKNNSLNLPAETTFIIHMNFTLKNKSSKELSWKHDGEEANLFLSEAYGSIVTPIGSGTTESLKAGQEASFNHFYASTAEEIEQLVFYLDDGQVVEKILSQQ